MTLADYSLKICRRHKKSMTFVLFDLNKFKIINDLYGHHEGDFVLTMFAQIMLESFRECDVIARLGGDEFVTMLVDCNDDQINAILKRFTENIESANTTLDKPYTIEYSIGFAHFHMILINQ